nr:kelch domain-containing protein 4 [Ipomoea batatas]
MFFGICKPSLDIRYVTISDGLSSSPASAIDVAIKKVLGCIRSAINSGYGDGLTFFLSSFSNPSHTSMTFGGGLGLMNEIPLLTAVVDPFVVVVFGKTAHVFSGILVQRYLKTKPGSSRSRGTGTGSGFRDTPRPRPVAIPTLGLSLDQLPKSTLSKLEHYWVDMVYTAVNAALSPELRWSQVRMGKKTKKPGKGKEKTERKTAKAEEKKSRRASKKLSPEDDIDAILLSIQKEEAKKKEVHVEENVPAPSPRSNCSLNVNPLKETEIILYGGEFYNGSKTFVYGNLYRYDVEKLEWKLVSSPNSPPPRSAHQTVAWKNYLYIFGGEFTSPNQERFHHYKDFWVLDLKTNQWEQLNYKGCPSPRSGHRMVLYKHKIIVFGGFYDTLREVRYYNDLHVFDLDQFKWQEIKGTPGCMWPSARSGFQFFVHQDEIYLYGGYSKEISPDKSVSEKGVVHSDMWSLDPRTWQWNKVKKSGMPPGPRAGFSMCIHKKRAILFGGVVDMDIEGDVMMSLFLNELYGFQVDSHRWYPLELRKEKSSKDKLKRTVNEKPENMELDSKPTTMNVENLVFDDEYVDFADDEKAGMEGNLNNISSNMKRNLSIDECKVETRSQEKSLASVSKSSVQSSVSPEVVKPCGRINSCVAVARDTLYVYGGMMEVRDQEVTLDDLYTLNLSKLDEWKCIIPASEPEWIEASDDEDDEEEDEDGSDNEGENGDDSDDDSSEDDSAEGGNTGSTSVKIGDAVAIMRGEGKTLRRKEKRARIEQIRVHLGLSDSHRTPAPGESLRDFYRRTNTYWQMAAYEHTQHTGKELRKDGFDLAESRYKELKPILDELAILEAEQKAEEEEGPETISKKRGGNKKSKNLAS